MQEIHSKKIEGSQNGETQFKILGTPHTSAGTISLKKSGGQGKEDFHKRTSGVEERMKGRQ